MMKYFLIFAQLVAIFSFSQKCYAQETKIPATRKFHLGINFSPDYCYRTLENNDGSQSSEMIINLRDNNERPVFGFTAGVNARYNLWETVAIESGVQFSDKGYGYKSTELFFGDPIDPRNGLPYSTTDPGSVPESVRLHYHFYYLDIPMRIVLTIGKKKIRFTTSAGITTNIFLKATQTAAIKYPDGATERTTSEQPYDFKTINFSPLVSAGVEYKINPRMKLLAEPTFRYGLMKIIDTPITGYLWNGGFNIGVMYNL